MIPVAHEPCQTVVFCVEALFATLHHARLAIAFPRHLVVVKCLMNKRRRHLIDFIDEAMIPHLIERLCNI